MISFVLGISFALSRYLVFLPKYRETKTEVNLAENKIYNIWFFKNGWHVESVTCLTNNNAEEEIKVLTTAWFSVMQDEEILKDKICVQSVIIYGKTIYLSCDQSFLVFSSAQDNFTLISGLLKTLFEAGYQNYSIYFLVHHKHLSDILLDFSVSWPTALYKFV